MLNIIPPYASNHCCPLMTLKVPDNFRDHCRLPRHLQVLKELHNPYAAGQLLPMLGATNPSMDCSVDLVQQRPHRPHSIPLRERIKGIVCVHNCEIL